MIHYFNMKVQRLLRLFLEEFIQGCDHLIISKRLDLQQLLVLYLKEQERKVNLQKIIEGELIY